MNDFGTELRRWRAARRLSQLALAGDAGISSRHLAFLETGRARPSRGMVLRLAGVLDLPHGAANGFLQAAGFAGHYPAVPLTSPDMAGVRQAMEWTISRHAPFPALIMDRLWRIVSLNGPARALFGALGMAVGGDLLAALDGPMSPAALLETWGEVAHHTMMRLRTESARAGGIAELDAAAARLAHDPALLAERSRPADRVIVPTIYRAGPARLSMFSTYAQFGSAEEVALSQMKIELMFPADAATEAFFLAHQVQPRGESGRS